jgi:hypothetical protein
MLTFNFTKKISIFISIILLFSLNSCFIAKAVESKHARKEFTEENKAIPRDFGKKDQILICVLKGRSSYDNYLKRAVKKNYKGKYIFVTNLDMYVSKYDDKDIYRYYFDYDGGTTMTTSWSDGLSASSTLKRFFIGDRLENKKYQCGAEFGFFANAMKIYMANLEVKRISRI